MVSFIIPYSFRGYNSIVRNAGWQVQAIFWVKSASYLKVICLIIWFLNNPNLDALYRDDFGISLRCRSFGLIH